MLASAFILGFLGSFHCVGMCGPIAFMLPLDRNNQVKKFLQILSYHTGRFISYATIGAIFGMLGTGFYLSGYQQQLSIFVGVLMILTVITPQHLLQKVRITQPIYKLISKLKSALGKQFKKRSFSSLFTIGLLNGLLPCGLVYMAVFGALALGNPIESGLYMVLFGMGTLPLMSVAAYLGNFLNVTTRKRIQKLVPVFIAIIGVFFILRGLGLGIPYVSPSNMNLMVKEAPTCH
ncbi:sulfite exporter TauE/SafE family protein [Neptunitalea lumnitzerae]|uniref:Membrane protein n=1 Tax=Neptunitalea lumnitzerae TaxID=2965509 RepID=A0ABQ5MHM0_9FLAO|nr:sulfite exporter TauE/SafE family protein [Neptunitalea sp. Y10]GLB48899.1 membrane protein [Neptunitalea sp. Y10]